MISKHFEFATLLGVPGEFWLVFFVIVAALLIGDLAFLARRYPVLSFRQSLYFTSFVWLIAISFGVWIWTSLGEQAGQDYFAAWIIEQSLSLDNVLIMSVIFASLGIDRKYRHRALVLGILLAMVFRAIFIFFGVALVTNLEWALVLFAALLIYLGAKVLVVDDDPYETYQRSWTARIVNLLPVDNSYRGHSLFTKSAGKWVATPVAIALLAISIADIAFAIDSVPAVLAITSDPFLVYTSNIMAIVGMRALFYMLEDLVNRFAYIQPALGLLLVAVGLKILADKFLFVIPSTYVIGFTALVIGLAIVMSIIRDRKPKS